VIWVQLLIGYVIHFGGAFFLGGTLDVAGLSFSFRVSALLQAAHEHNAPTAEG